jgi:hypothetical protein
LQADASQQNILVARFDVDGTPDGAFGSSSFKLGMPPAGRSFRAEGMTLAGGNIVMAGSDYDSTTGDEHPLLMWFLGASNASAAQSAHLFISHRRHPHDANNNTSTIPHQTQVAARSFEL